MMQYSHEVNVHLKEGASKLEAFALARKHGGLLHRRLEDATAAAVAISQHKDVKRVDITSVHRSCAGVWRNGHRSDVI